jgi:hypothetical protein
VTADSGRIDRSVRDLLRAALAIYDLDSLPATRAACGPGHPRRGNLGSRQVLEADGGALARIVDGEVHYWLPTSQWDT